MKQIKKYVWLMLFFTPFIYGQNSIKDQLINKWISSVKIFDAKDTIASSNEILQLKADGSMLLLNAGRGMSSRVDSTSGTWQFDKSTNQLQMSMAMGERTETVSMTVDQVSDQNLRLTQKRGERSKSVIYIPKKGERVKKEQLMSNWISSIKIINHKDTVKSTNTNLGLKPEGIMVFGESDKTIEGSSQFHDIFNTLYLSIHFGDRIERRTLKVDQVSNQSLTLTDTKRRDVETVVYIKKP